MRNYKNRTKFINKKFFVAGLIIAAHIFVFSKGGNLNSKFDVSVVSAMDLDPKEKKFTFFKGKQNLEKELDGKKLDGVKLVTELNKIDQVLAAIEAKQADLKTAIDQAKTAYDAHRDDPNRKTALETAQNNMNTFIETVRSPFERTYKKAAQEFLYREAKSYREKALRESGSVVSQQIMQAKQTTPDGPYFTASSDPKTLSSAFYEQFYSAANGRTIQNSAFYVGDIAKDNFEKYTTPMLVDIRGLKDYFSVFYEAIDRANFNKKLSDRDRNSFALVVTGLIVNTMMVNYTYFTGISPEMLRNMVYELLLENGFTTNAAGAIIQIVFTTNKEPADAFIADTNALSADYPYIYTASADDLTVAANMVRVEGKKAFKKKEFKKAYANYYKGYKRFNIKDIEAYWDFVEKKIYGRVGFDDVVITDQAAELLPADNNILNKVKSARKSLMESVLKNIPKRMRIVHKTAVERTVRIFNNLSDQDGMAPVLEYVEQLHGGTVGTEGATFNDMPTFVDFLSGKVVKYKGIIKKINKIFGYNYNKDDDDDDDDDDEKRLRDWLSRRGYDNLINNRDEYNINGRDLPEVVPIIVSMKKYFSDLKDKMTSFANQPNMDENDRTKKAAGIREKYAKRLAEIFVEMLKYVRNESEMFSSYLAKFGDEKEQTSIKAAVDALLKELVSSNKIHDIKDVYAFSKAFDNNITGMGSFIGTRLAGQAAQQLKNALVHMKKRNKNKQAEVGTCMKSIKRILFNEALYLFFIKNCFRDFYNTGLFELTEEKKYDLDKTKESGKQIFKGEIDKTKTPAENLKIVMEEFIKTHAEVKTFGGIYLDFAKQDNEVKKLEEAINAVYKNLDDAVGMQKDDDEEDKKEKGKKEKDEETEEGKDEDKDKEETEEGKEKAENETVTPKEEEEIMRDVTSGGLTNTALFGFDNVNIANAKLNYKIGAGTLNAELFNDPRLSQGKIMAVVIYNKTQVQDTAYYMNLVGDKVTATLPIDVGEKDIALHFYLENPANPGVLYRENFIGGADLYNYKQAVKGKIKCAGAYREVKVKEKDAPAIRIIDMGSSLMVYVKKGKFDDIYEQMAIMCAKDPLPADIGTGNRFIFQRLQSGNFVLLINGRLRELVRDKFSAHIYRGTAEASNFQYFIQSLEDAEDNGGKTELEKVENNDELEDKEDKMEEEKGNKIKQKVKDNDDEEEKAVKPKKKGKKNDDDAETDAEDEGEKEDEDEGLDILNKTDKKDKSTDILGFNDFNNDFTSILGL